MLFYEENSTKGKIRYTLLQFIVIIYFFTLGIDSIQASWRGSEKNQFIFKRYQISDDITSPFRISDNIFESDTLYYLESNIIGAFITFSNGKTSSDISGIKATYQDKKGNQWLLTLKPQSPISLIRLSDNKEIKFQNSEFVGLFFKTDEENKVELNPDFEEVRKNQPNQLPAEDMNPEDFKKWGLKPLLTQPALTYPYIMPLPNQSTDQRIWDQIIREYNARELERINSINRTNMNNSIKIPFHNE